jgi:hypothetical protein
VCFIASPDFETLAGYPLTIVRALYGLRTSDARWHGRFSDVIHLLRFTPCKADPDVWMHDCITHYEYDLVYVDHIMFIGKEPRQFFDSLINEHGLKHKVVGAPIYHLGGDYFRESDGTLAWVAHSYITKFICKPKEFATPMIEKDHPEIYTAALLDSFGIKKFQSLIGALWWLVTLGRFDIH